MKIVLLSSHCEEPSARNIFAKRVINTIELDFGIILRNTLCTSLIILVSDCNGLFFNSNEFQL